MTGRPKRSDVPVRETWDLAAPHYYLGLYPYTYVAGLATATEVAQAVWRDGGPAIGRWLAGVDLAGTEPLRGAVSYVAGLVEELEAALGPA